VRLPRKYRFDDKEVYIKRLGNTVILIPKNNPWENLVNSLEVFSGDFLEDRHQPVLQNRDALD
ncbi:MAG: AbrB/MazE/SpoVT family DNA-binding domain-containing protein, partial [FCB group bacterium]|nr:AbrB/MazE/SpoVT family DNA-binding domain-containing protein [FCB group bacterium]